MGWGKIRICFKKESEPHIKITGVTGGSGTQKRSWQLLLLSHSSFCCLFKVTKLLCALETLTLVLETCPQAWATTSSISWQDCRLPFHLQVSDLLKWHGFVLGFMLWVYFLLEDHSSHSAVKFCVCLFASSVRLNITLGLEFLTILHSVLSVLPLTVPTPWTGRWITKILWQNQSF